MGKVALPWGKGDVQYNPLYPILNASSMLISQHIIKDFPSLVKLTRIVKFKDNGNIFH